MAKTSADYQILMNGFMLKHADWDKQVIYATENTKNKAKQIHDSIKEDIKTARDDTFLPMYKLVIPFVIVIVLFCHFVPFLETEHFAYILPIALLLFMTPCIIIRLWKSMKADEFFKKHARARIGKKVSCYGVLKLQYKYILNRIQTCRNEEELQNLKEIEKKLKKRLRSIWR